MLREPTDRHSYQMVQHDQLKTKGATVAAQRRVGRRFFSLRSFRQTTLQIQRPMRRSSDHGGNSDWYTMVGHPHTREFSRLLPPATDVKPLQSPLPADRLSPREKSRQTDADRMHLFSSRPDRAADRCANTAAAAAVCRRLRRGSQSQPTPSRVGSRAAGLPYLRAPSIDRSAIRHPETRA